MRKAILERQQEIFNEQSNVSKQSEQARYLKENPMHSFECKVLTIVKHYLRCWVSEMLYIAYHRPNLNKQVVFWTCYFPQGHGNYLNGMQFRARIQLWWHCHKHCLWNWSVKSCIWYLHSTCFVSKVKVLILLFHCLRLVSNAKYNVHCGHILLF